jgi:hypothetical protein
LNTIQSTLNSYSPSQHLQNNKKHIMPGRRGSNAADKAPRVSGSSSQGLEQQAATNELRKGKNESTERRRIQNRINQRAFRARQKSGEVPRLRGIREWHVIGFLESDRRSDDACCGDAHIDCMHMLPAPAVVPSPTSTTRLPQLDTSNVWDNLASLINSNFLCAIEENATHLGITTDTLHSGVAHLLSKTPINLSIPTSLWPCELQYHMPHDPIIDVIPHMQLRYNILVAIGNGILNEVEFCTALRASGSLEHIAGQWLRNGMVVWNSVPDQASNWEITDAVWCKWPFLFRGCVDLVHGSNVWKAGRGDPALR